MIAAQQTAEHLRELGYSTDSIALNLGITQCQLAELERAPAEPKRTYARCGGALA